MSRNSPSEHAKDFKYMQKTGNDGNEYASLPDKNNIFKWKKINMDETNAINIYKFWHSKNELEKNIKYNYKDALNNLKLLKTELKKSNINFYYLDYMGEWSGLDLHFIDYSWDEAEEQAKLDKVEKQSIIFTDDIYMLSAILHGKLYFQHNILKKDINSLKLAFNKIYNIELNFSSKKSILINLKLL